MGRLREPRVCCYCNAYRSQDRTSILRHETRCLSRSQKPNIELSENAKSPEASAVSQEVLNEMLPSSTNMTKTRNPSGAVDKARSRRSKPPCSLSTPTPPPRNRGLPQTTESQLAPVSADLYMPVQDFASYDNNCNKNYQMATETSYPSYQTLPSLSTNVQQFRSVDQYCKSITSNQDGDQRLDSLEQELAAFKVQQAQLAFKMQRIEMWLNEQFSKSP